MKIVIVDDNDTFRTSIKLFLEEKYGHQITAESNRADNILDSKEIYQADIILMDIVMPGMDGIEASKLILQKHSKVKIIVITMHTEKAFLKQLINTGVKGCIFKDQIFNNISSALNSVLKGQPYFPEEIPI